MRILLATDGTKHSDCAIQMIDKFALSDGDEIKIVSVVDLTLPPSIDFYSGYLPNASELEQSAQENAEKIMESAKARIEKAFTGKKIFVSTEALLGSPERRIVETAEEMKADLIIVGSHGYNRWERLLLGSVSDSVIHHAPCSVMVVRNVSCEGDK